MSAQSLSDLRALQAPLITITGDYGIISLNAGGSRVTFTQPFSDIADAQTFIDASIFSFAYSGGGNNANLLISGNKMLSCNLDLASSTSNSIKIYDSENLHSAIFDHTISDGVSFHNEWWITNCPKLGSGTLDLGLVRLGNDGGGRIGVISLKIASCGLVNDPLSAPVELFDGATLDLSGNAFTAAAVNSMLAKLLASALEYTDPEGLNLAYTNGVTINFTGGTSSAPTGQGITDKTALNAITGITVTTN